jgi:hypothetical protein
MPILVDGIGDAGSAALAVMRCYPGVLLAIVRALRVFDAEVCMLSLRRTSCHVGHYAKVG